MTRQEFSAGMATMVGALASKELSAPAAEGYWIALQRLDAPAWKLAVGRALTECKFLPPPIELLAFAGITPKNPAIEGVKAWQAVRSAIDKHDWSVNSIDFGPLVNAVIRNLGGWDAMCRATLPELDNPGWLRKRFDAVYLALYPTNHDSLNGEPLRGQLPPDWRTPSNVVVAIDGVTPPKRLESSEAKEAQAHVRALADGMSR